MKKPSWKSLYKFGLPFAEMFVPGLELAVQGVEAAHAAGKAGTTTKLQEVEQVSDALLPLASGLTSLQLDTPDIKAARTALIEAYVASMDAKAAYEHAKDTLQAVIDRIKTGQS